MDEKERQSAFMTALTTEHFVLQTAVSAAASEATSRSSVYLLSLSSSLVAMGFASQSRDAFLPFVATVLPALFLLGVFTVVRLVDVNLENMQFLQGIARIRGYYRTLGPEAAEYFAAEHGRWPEKPVPPALWLGSLLAYLTTSASLIALVNSIVAGAGVVFLASKLLTGGPTAVSVSLGVAAAVIMMTAFLLYQQWRYSTVDADGEPQQRRESDQPKR